MHRIGQRVYELLTLMPYLCSLQERAYLLLRMGSDGSEFNSSDSNSGRFEYEGDHHNVQADGDVEHDREDEEEEEEEEEVEAGEGEEEQVRGGGAVHEEQIDGALFDSDEAFARALQEKEDRDTTARLMALAGIHDRKFSSQIYSISLCISYSSGDSGSIQHDYLFLCPSRWKLVTCGCHISCLLFLCS